MKTFDVCSDSLLSFRSKYKLLSYLKTHGRYVEPVDVELGTRYEQKLNRNGIHCQVLKRDSCQYTSIIERMKMLKDLPLCLKHTNQINK
jgi:hypothetical protein